jgi:hypothetical protein
MPAHGPQNVARGVHMRTPRTPITGRGPTEEVESSWLGAEALPGGVVSADAQQDADPDAAVSANGMGAWIAAVLSWARRRHPPA